MVDWFAPADIDWLGGGDVEEDVEEAEVEETQEESI